MRAAKAPHATAQRETRFIVSDVDSPVYRLNGDENNFAFLIGIQDYENLPAADYAERDASAMRTHLLALSYPERNIILLTGKSAGRASIEKYLESWLPRNLNEKSRLFVYFSGLGATSVKDGGAYLVPWDGDPQYLESTGYPLKEFYRALDSLKAKQVVVAMDTCFSGAGGRSVIAKGTRPLVSTVDTRVAGSGKLLVLAASAGDEAAGTQDAQGHGLFTYQLLKALNDAKGDATVKQLFDALTPRVRDTARGQNRDQTPQFMTTDLIDASQFRLDH